jgi:hypothetical protein
MRYDNASGPLMKNVFYYVEMLWTQEEEPTFQTYSKLFQGTL